MKPYLLILSIGILLVKVPPFYVIPGIELSSSYNVVRLAILSSFISLLFLQRKKQAIFRGSSLLFLVSFYFFGQSISILYASNIAAFLNVYKDLVVSIVLFLTMLLVTKEDIAILVKVFLTSAVIGLVYQFVFIFFPYSIKMLAPFLNYIYMQFAEFQANRGRYFGDTMDEALIPLLFFYLVTTKKILLKVVIVILILSVIFLVILSSWRTKFIICLYAILLSFFLFKQLKKYFLIYFPVLIIVFAVNNVVSFTLVGQNIYDRLLVNNNSTERLIQDNRLSFFQDAYQIGKEHILTGVGIGNYYDNLPGVKKRAHQSPSASGARTFITIDDPHNILFSVFATTGSIGLISICALLVHFFITDIALFYRASWGKIFVVVFWGYFIFSFFNPWMYFPFLIPFWFFRGIIENIKHNQ